MVYLLLESIVPALFQILHSISLLFGLSLQSFHHLLFETEFVLHLSNILLMSLLALSQFILQALQLFVLLLQLLSSLSIQLFLEVMHSSIALFSLFINPQFQFLLFHLVEVLQLSQRLFTFLLHLLDFFLC